MALPADGRTDLADLVTIGNAISAMISPALVDAVVGLSIVHSENCPDNSNVIKFRKAGSLIAESVSEGAVYTPSDANSDMNDSSVTATAAKIGVISPISVEALRFGGGAANFARIAQEQGRAIGRKFDDDLLALFDSITNTATASTTMDTDTLLTAQYNIFNAGTPPGTLVALLGYKQVVELKKVMATSGAAQYANAGQIAMLNGSPKANNFVGNFCGVDIYQTSGHSTTGGDIQGAMWHPDYGFAAALGGAIESQVMWTGAGVASQVAGFSYQVSSHIFYNVVVYNNTCCSEVRSDS